MVFGEPAELAAYQKLVDAFEKEHPEIDIELGHIPGQSDYRRRLATDFAGGSPPDVMLLNYRRFAAFASQGGLEPLTQYLADSDVIAETDFFPITVESFYFEQDIWCVPQNVSSLVVYYNRDIFDAAGIVYPDEDWTREEFLIMARELTKDFDGDGQIDQFGVGIDPSIFRLAPFIWQDGGELVDDPAAPTRLVLDQPLQLETFQWFVNLSVKEHVVPDAVEEEAEESESRFLNGTLAMYFNSRRGVPTYRTITGFQWDVAALPMGEQPAGILHSDGYCMAAKAENKDAAWTFIEYANSNTGQTLISETGRTVPSRPEVADSPVFLNDSVAPANARVFIDTVPILKGVPVMAGWASIEETTNREVERAFYGWATVQEAAASAIEITQPFFDESD
jgi:multiple sugar transport system substrate-binding protein